MSYRDITHHIQEMYGVEVATDALTAVTDQLLPELKGEKEILGLYLSESEWANYLTVLTDIQNQGVEDILIACVDGLTGFPEAISSIFPQTEVQWCIIHQIRNSMKYVASKSQRAFMADLKPVYRATLNTPKPFVKLFTQRITKL
jgi:putative transposase